MVNQPQSSGKQVGHNSNTFLIEIAMCTKVYPILIFLYQENNKKKKITKNRH